MAQVTANDGTPLDPTAAALTKSIRSAETGGDYNAVGASGERGAYQWMPGRFEATAQRYGLDPSDFSPVNQDKVKYAEVLDLLRQGYTQSQIAAEHNSGSPTGWEGKVGVNQFGVKYDVPAYVEKVKNNYLQEVQGGVAPQQEYSAPAVQEKPVDSRSLPEKVDSAVLGGAKKVSDFFGGKGITDLIGGLIAKTSVPAEQRKFVDLPKANEVAGSALQLGSTFLPYGVLAKGVGAAVRGVGLGAKAAQVAGGIGAGAIGGAAANTGAAIQEGKNLDETVEAGRRGAVVGAAIPAALDTVGAVGGAVANAGAQKAISELERSYRKALSGTKTGIKQIEKAARYSHDDAAFLAKKGLTLDLTDDASKFDTSAARAALSKDMDALDDVLTDALKSTRGYVYLDDYEQAALKAVDNASNRAEGTLSARQKQVRRIIQEYRKTYGDIIDFGTLNEIKRGQRKLTGIFDASRPHFAGDVHYQMSDVAKDLIENGAKGAGLDGIEEFNKLFGDHISASRALEKLHGTAVKGGRLGRMLMRNAAGLAGSVAGTAVHGPVGSVLGFLAGEATANQFGKILAKQQVSSPLRDAILKRLQQEDPAVVQQLMNYSRGALAPSQASMPINTIGQGMELQSPSIAPMITGKAAPRKGLVQYLLEQNLAPGDRLLRGAP